MLSTLKHSKFARSLLSAIAGLLAYGAWAFYANHAHGFDAAIKAAITQGLYSFLVTLCLTLSIDYLYHTLSLPTKIKLFSIWLLASSAIYVTSWSVNFFAGTPEILMTILPGVTISAIYNFSYLLTLQKITGLN